MSKIKEFWEDHKEDIITAIAIGVIMGASAALGAIVGYSVGQFDGFCSGVKFTNNYYKSNPPVLKVDTQPSN